MTALDRTLAQTFRAARWAATNGNPVCPSCFDGADLEKPKPDPFTPELSRYSCTVCRRKFSDVLGTAYQVRSPAPLAILAHLTMVRDPRQIEGLSPEEISRYWPIVERIRRSGSAAAWRRELDRSTITPAKLAKQILAQRRTA